jgi:hypothetical protein
MPTEMHRAALRVNNSRGIGGPTLSLTTKQRPFLDRPGRWKAVGGSNDNLFYQKARY